MPTYKGLTVIVSPHVTDGQALRVGNNILMTARDFDNLQKMDKLNSEPAPPKKAPEPEPTTIKDKPEFYGSW